MAKKNRSEIRVDNDNFYDTRGDSVGGINNLINAEEQKRITDLSIENAVYKKAVKGSITSGAIVDPLDIELDYSEKDSYTVDTTGRIETLFKINPQNLEDGQIGQLRILKNSNQEIDFINID